MIPIGFVIFLAIAFWLFLMIYLYGLEFNPWWLIAGIPLPFIILLAVGYFYYELPLIDFDSTPAFPVRVVE